MAAGRRVLVSGMGGDLGSRVAELLEQEDWVGELVGIDVDPPRRRLHRADVPPHLTRRARPHRRDDHGVQPARRRPHRGVGAALARQPGDGPPAHRRRRHVDPRRRGRVPGAGVRRRAQRHRGLRPGPRRADPARRVGRRRPDLRLRQMLAGIERTAAAIGRRVGVSVGAIRMGTVLGPHVPSPLGRVLRHAGRAVQRARRSAVRRRRGRRRRPGRSSPRPGAASPSRSTSSPTARSPRCRPPAAAGGSPCPLVGPEWFVARPISGLLGAPIPDHVVETLHRGRLADNGAHGGAARLHVADDDDGRHRRAVRVADGRAASRPGGRWR